jgi:hypothetical protein
MSTADTPNEAAQQKFVAKLNQFRSSLDADEQRMLDAVVVASYWPTTDSEVQGYISLVPPYTIYDDSAEPKPFETTPWGKVFTYI